MVKNLRESLPQDERRDLFHVPGLVEQMLGRGLLGDKTGQGFYKKVKGETGDESEILTLDLATFEYRARQRAAFPFLDMARNVDDLREVALELPDHLALDPLGGHETGKQIVVIRRAAPFDEDVAAFVGAETRLPGRVVSAHEGIAQVDVGLERGDRTVG